MSDQQLASVIKYVNFVTDPSARVAQIETGKCDITLGVPFEEYDRLKKLPTLSGVTCS